jgi:hypothetical protein
MSYASTNTLIIGNKMPGYHTKKDGTKAKKGLYYNMNKKKLLVLQTVKLNLLLVLSLIVLC